MLLERKWQRPAYLPINTKKNVFEEQFEEEIDIFFEHAFEQIEEITIYEI